MKYSYIPTRYKEIGFQNGCQIQDGCPNKVYSREAESKNHFMRDGMLGSGNHARFEV